MIRVIDVVITQFSTLYRDIEKKNSEVKRRQFDIWSDNPK